jgi:hypothetical protein
MMDAVVMLGTLGRSDPDESDAWLNESCDYGP